MALKTSACTSALDASKTWAVRRATYWNITLLMYVVAKQSPLATCNTKFSSCKTTGCRDTCCTKSDVYNGQCWSPASKSVCCMQGYQGSVCQIPSNFCCENKVGNSTCSSFVNKVCCDDGHDCGVCARACDNANDWMFGGLLSPNCVLLDTHIE